MGLNSVQQSASEVSRRAVLGGVSAVGLVAAVPAAAATAAPERVRVRERDRLVDYEVVELAALLRAGTVTAVQVTTAYLERIDRFNGPFEVYDDNGGYNAFVRVDREGALAQARAADERLAEHRRTGARVPPLLGIPLGVKETLAVKGLESKNGSQAFTGNVALRDATVVAKLRAAGAVILGHTMVSEFSWSIVGRFAGNAWDRRYIPGGSSQGSGVAPVARLAAAALGEETGGSIVFPAAANGATAIKPSPGLTSTGGLMPLSPSYDVVGPMARSMRDAALLLSVVLGPDPAGDPLTLATPNPFPALPARPRPGARPLAGVTIGIPLADWMYVGGTARPPAEVYHPDHRAALARLREQLVSLGAVVKEFPGLDVDRPANNPYHRSADVLATVEGVKISPVSAVVLPNRFEVGFHEAVRAFAATRSEAAAAVLRAAYGSKAADGSGPTFEVATRVAGAISTSVRAEGERRRRQLRANYQAALAGHGVDFMLVLTFGAHLDRRANPEVLTTPVRDHQLANALAWPMVSFPIGYAGTPTLPISAQFWGPRFSEPKLVQAVLDYQHHFPEYHNAAPPDPAPAPRARVRPSPLRPARPVPARLSANPLAAEGI